MLQQILRDMYIDPELLAELDEDQKQILFCKMREEQIRQWTERETKLTKEDENNKCIKPKKKNGKKVDFLLDATGREWVWVMGESAGDKSIEQIMEEEAQEKARKLAEKEAEELRKTEEKELTEKMEDEERQLKDEEKRKEEELRKQQLDEKTRKEEEEKEHKKLKLERRHSTLRHEMQRKRSLEHIKEFKRRRSSDIYMSFMAIQSKNRKQAEESGQIIEQEWIEQEKKSKAAQEEMREIARRAREEHRRTLTESLRTDAHIIGTLAAGLKDARIARQSLPVIPGPKKPPRLALISKPPKPDGRRAVIEWFKEIERPRGSGLDPSTDKIAPWFHGIITRQDAEDLLNKMGVGYFLMRVSERIWGYAISYRGKDRCKHFLIDTSDGSYQFFGTNQLSHVSLADLVEFYKTKPISMAGQELLVHPCPQTQDPPDYEELFPDLVDETSYL